MTKPDLENYFWNVNSRSEKKDSREKNVEKKENIRELIVEMVKEISAGNEYSHILIKNVLDKYAYLPSFDRAFIKKVTEGTIERQITIDYVLNQFSKVPVNKMKPFIRSLMRTSVYQILYLDKVPDSAVCNEAVKLAAKRGFQNLKGFVNGVLRSIARQKETLVFPDKEKEPIRALCVIYSMPEAIVTLLVKQYGMERAETILQGYLVERPVCVRISERLSLQEREEIFAYWEKAGVQARKHPWLSYAYELTQTGNLKEDPYFAKGWYTVQDISSMLVCEIAGIKEKDFIIDVCSAPGGKALHACDKLKGSGSVDARDVTENKILIIEENKARMQADCLSVKVWDAREKDLGAVKKADVLLLDIPCSGLGVMGRKPEIRYRLTEESFAELAILQKEIADTVWEYVKPGGTLIYSTCTLRKEENEQMVFYLMEKYGFVLESLNPYLVEELHSDDTKKGYLTLLPGENTDGFFMARLLRP